MLDFNLLCIILTCLHPIIVYKSCIYMYKMSADKMDHSKSSDSILLCGKFDHIDTKVNVWMKCLRQML